MLNNFNPSSTDPNNPNPNNNGGNGSGGGSNNGNGNTGGPNNNTGNPIPNFPWSNVKNDSNDFDPNEYLINYNMKFQNEKPTMFRDEVIQQTLSCLIGMTKPNALLVGAAGVGKTKIVEDIARRIANNDDLIPPQIANYTIWELPLSNIIAGSGIVGEIERKTKDILEFAANPANNVILFIDEIHMILSDKQTYDKVAQIIKPALARGDIKVIGATTLQESQDLKNDPAFNRRFTRIIVDELTKEQTKDILKSLSVKLFTHYSYTIAINDKVIDEIVSVADEYKTLDSHRPDNAITLADRAMADAFIQRKLLEQQAKTDPVLANALAQQTTIVLSKSQMKKTAMRLMTGNDVKPDIDMFKLNDNLSVIKGQNNIINYLMDKLERDNLNLYPRTKPLTFLFAGNSGVGKTEIAKIIAKTITNQKPIILNMTEYHSSASINRIIGAPAGYVGSDSKAELPFDILESNPYQIILLDELEKADKAVQRLFMNAFDEGFIKTSRGKIVDFSRTIIIATTNAGHTSKSDPIGFLYDDNTHDEATISELSAFFDKEFLNRFTKVLNFNAITKSLFREILVAKYNKDVAVIKANHSSYKFLPDTLSDEEFDELTEKHYVKEFGARHVAQIVQEWIESTIIANKRAKMTASTASTENNETYMTSDNISDVSDVNDVTIENSDETMLTTSDNSVTTE